MKLKILIINSLYEKGYICVHKYLSKSNSLKQKNWKIFRFSKIINFHDDLNISLFWIKNWVWLKY